MILDLLKDIGKLYYRINDGDKYNVFDIIERDSYTSYCMAVCCGWTNECVELISYASSQL